jgi:hypothetical protein
MSPSARRAVTWLLAGSAIAYLVATTLQQFVIVLQGGFATDYLSFASAGRILLDGHGAQLYDPALQRSVQVQLIGQDFPGLPIGYVNPPIAGWVLQPLASLPLSTGARIFVSLDVAAMLGTLVLLWAAMERRPRIREQLDLPQRLLLLVAVVVIYAGSSAYVLGQWDPLLMLFAALALTAIDRDRPVVAGVLLSALLIKPQLVWLLVVPLVVGRQWRMLGGFAAGGAVIALASVPILGPDNLSALSVITSDHYLTNDRNVPTLAGIATQLNASPNDQKAAAVVLAAIGAVVCWKARAALSDPGIAVAAGLFLSQMAIPHQHDYDFLLLAPAAVVWAGRQPRLALVAALALNVAGVIQVMAQTNEIPNTTVVVALSAYLAWQATKRDALPKPAAAT